MHRQSTRRNAMEPLVLASFCAWTFLQIVATIPAPAFQTPFFSLGKLFSGPAVVIIAFFTTRGRRYVPTGLVMLLAFSIIYALGSLRAEPWQLEHTLLYASWGIAFTVVFPNALSKVSFLRRYCRWQSVTVLVALGIVVFAAFRYNIKLVSQESISRERVSFGLNPTYIGNIGATLVSLGLASLCLYESPRWGYILAVMGLVVIVQADSRTMMIFAFVSGFSYLYYARPRLRWFVGLSTVVLLAVVVQQLYVLSELQSADERLNTFSSGRVELWRDVLSTTFAREDVSTYLIGNGSAEWGPRAWTHLEGEYSAVPHIDNGFLDALCIAGLAGLLSLIGAIVLWWRAVCPPPRSAPAPVHAFVRSVIVGILAASATSTLFPSFGNTFVSAVLPLAVGLTQVLSSTPAKTSTTPDDVPTRSSYGHASGFRKPTGRPSAPPIS